MKLKSQRIYNIVLIFVGIAGWGVTVFLLGESEQINFISGFFCRNCHDRNTQDCQNRKNYEKPRKGTGLRGYAEG